jgi:hypothetical protein
MGERRRFEKMVEMMRNCCLEEHGMADCCSMMRKMMRCGEGEETAKKKKETEEATSMKQE